MAYVTVLRVDPAHVDIEPAAPESVEAVGAEKSERMDVGELVPQSLEPDCRLVTPLAPEYVDHLAVRANAVSMRCACGSFQHRPHSRAKPIGIGQIADH